MAKSRKPSELNIEPPPMKRGRKPVVTAHRVHLPRQSCRNHFDLVEPQINAEGVHVWPFDVSFPVEVLFLTTDDRRHVRMNRHGYFEVLYLCSGSAVCHIQDRFLPMNEGDVVLIGSTLYHRIECASSTPATIAALFFEPDMIRCDGSSDSAEYLTPFLLQDADFPHVVEAKTGVPREVLDLMLRIRAELPADSTRSRLGVRTYMKMLLLALVNQYAAYTGTVETFQRQQRDLDRLQPLFRYLGRNSGNDLQVKDASRICGMSESHFMSFFKRVTGLSFMKYLNHYRIERAQALLSNSEDSIAGISQEVGFCDQSYFGTTFRKLVGMTPATYRRRFCKKTTSGPGQVDHSPRISNDASPRSLASLEIRDNNSLLRVGPHAVPVIRKAGSY